jgi:RNA recognition motif-containing protein
MFQAIGPVDSVNIVRDQMTGRPRGFAFVEMQTDEGAQAAIQQLNITELDGQGPPLHPKPTGGGGDRGGRPGGGVAPARATLVDKSARPQHRARNLYRPSRCP